MKKLVKGSTGRNLIQVLLFSLLLILLSGCQLGHEAKEDTQPLDYEDTRLLLNTVVRIQAYGPQAKQAVNAAFAEIERLEPNVDQYTESGLINKMNYQFGQDSLISSQAIKIPCELAELIRFSMHYSELTDGAFDITIGPLTQLWNLKERQNRLPTQMELDRAKMLVDYRKIAWDQDGNMIKMEKGMALDLGAVAKGYLVDQAMEKLTQYHVNGAIINAGGNVMTWGNNPGGYWQIGVADPQDSDKLLTTLKFQGSKSIVSAGNNERGYKIGGQLYGHILDISTGWPADKVLGTTVIGNHSLEADILSTSVYLIGVSQGLNLIQEAGYEGLIIDQAGRIPKSSGLEVYCKEFAKDGEL